MKWVLFEYPKSQGVFNLAGLGTSESRSRRLSQDISRQGDDCLLRQKPDQKKADAANGEDNVEALK